VHGELAFVAAERGKGRDGHELAVSEIQAGASVDVGESAFHDVSG
jgi:hypothetical protein